VQSPESRSTHRSTPHRSILGVRIDATSYAEATERILAWAGRGESRYVCLGAVNNIMEARRSAEYREVMDRADLVTSDGMPLVWMLRLLGSRSASRVYGPELMPLVLDAAADAGIPVGFYGGTADVLARLKKRFPRVRVAFAESPPFRELTAEEDRRTVEAIRNSGARIVFVGLGSPKQDRWMHAHKDRVQAVMLGVGAAFDFLAGAKLQAPRWMRASGLEWTFRLATEPRRLWRRYLTQNPKFVVIALAQLIRREKRGQPTLSTPTLVRKVRSLGEGTE
jgi:N-acetylglucosaminyldiphosphoundecaprenol N-acetyl-beta-D-mannosaminyltransferase